MYGDTMPKKEKEFPPKDMKELEEIFYGKTGDGKDVDWGRYRRYGSWVQGEALSPTFEAAAKQIFSPLGNAEKIHEIKGKKTFDFKIDQSKILLEITSLGVPLTALPTIFTDDLLFRKIQEAVAHITEKDNPELPDYFKGGVIFYETVFNWITKFHLKLDSELPRLTGLPDSKLDFLAFAAQSASIPVVFYVKDGPLVEVRKTAFADKNYKIIVFG